MKKEFQSIQTLHLALAAGSLLIFLMFYFVLGLNESDNYKELPLHYLIPAFLAMCIFMSKFMDRKMKASIKKEDSLSQKLTQYRERVIRRSALIEGAALFTLVFMYLTGNTLFAIYVGVGWLALLWVRPTLTEFVRDYGLSGQEQQEMSRD